MKILQIPLLRDNYGYLLICEATNQAAIIDPSEADPVLRRVEQEKNDLVAILNTHHHRDHTGGNEGVLAARRVDVYGHSRDRDRIPGMTRPIEEGDTVRVGALTGSVLFIPGHTTGHVAYVFGDALFCGDTLFTAGCGRLFEGTPEQMHASLSKLMNLPDDTRVFCGHEYTENNLRFALTVEPKNPDLISRYARVREQRSRGIPTVPATLAEEKRTNPFLRWDSKEIQASIASAASGESADPVSVFTKVRQLKDAF
jgi:hydroxyacylglutathione hydrolase